MVTPSPDFTCVKRPAPDDKLRGDFNYPRFLYCSRFKLLLHVSEKVFLATLEKLAVCRTRVLVYRGWRVTKMPHAEKTEKGFCVQAFATYTYNYGKYLIAERRCEFAENSISRPQTYLSPCHVCCFICRLPIVDCCLSAPFNFLGKFRGMSTHATSIRSRRASFSTQAIGDRKCWRTAVILKEHILRIHFLSLN